jgi:hypothetical protein
MRRLFIFNQTIQAISESRREESVVALQSFGQRPKGSQWLRVCVNGILDSVGVGCL